MVSLKANAFCPRNRQRFNRHAETMHRQLKRAAKMRYVYFLYISAMICILFAEKYTYPVKRWWKMTTKAQFDPNIPWDKVIEKRGAVLSANAAEGPSRRVASDGLSPDGNAHAGKENGAPSRSRCERCHRRRDLLVSMRSGVPVGRGPVPRHA